MPRREPSFLPLSKNSLFPCSFLRTLTIHAPSRHEETNKLTDKTLPSESGLFGGKISDWYALPIGIAAAIPAIKFEWYVINEETQLAAVFIAFCVTVYNSGGDAIYKFLDERAQSILKEHNKTEDKVIEALQLKLDFLKTNQNMVQDFESINEIREHTYKNLTAVGAIKPKHDLRYQVERVLNLITAEEASATEKTKIALMDEAIDSVTTTFMKSKQLKKSALEAAITAIKGEQLTNTDPVQASFVKFFKEKAVVAAKSGDESENASQRTALISKLNTVCKAEGFYFEFDHSGKPKMLMQV